MEKVYRAKELTEILNLSYPTIRKLIKNGSIKGVRAGREWKITESALNDFLNQSTGSLINKNFRYSKQAVEVIRATESIKKALAECYIETRTEFQIKVNQSGIADIASVIYTFSGRSGSATGFFSGGKWFIGNGSVPPEMTENERWEDAVKSVELFLLERPVNVIQQGQYRVEEYADGHSKVYSCQPMGSRSALIDSALKKGGTI